MIDMRRKPDKIDQRIEKLHMQHSGIAIRKLSIRDLEIRILYIAQLTDSNKFANNLIKPLLEVGVSEKLTIEKIAYSIITIDEVSIHYDDEKIIDYILNGYSVLVSSQEEGFIIVNTLQIEKRNTELPQVENSIRGPKDAFTENIDSNLSLIRYRIKDPQLRVDHFYIGTRTKTDVALLYIEDVANPDIIQEIINSLQNIRVDGIIESGYIQKFILKNTFNLFPQVGITERSDTACRNILQGKACILVHGSNTALVAPKTFIEFLDSSEDHYEQTLFNLFTKALRFIALFISLTASAFYVAVVSFHTEILPAKYILVLAFARSTVPLVAVLEALIMELIAEMLREASIRLPKQIGPAIGIVGTIVIGQAAVAAGLVSPLLVIIVSLSIMCSFIAPDYTIINPIRFLKFGLISITAIVGLFGFVIGLTLIAINLVSTTTFGVPYTAAVAPIHLRDIKDYLLSDITLSKKRPGFLNPNNKTRQK